MLIGEFGRKRFQKFSSFSLARYTTQLVCLGAARFSHFTRFLLMTDT